MRAFRDVAGSREFVGRVRKTPPLAEPRARGVGTARASGLPRGSQPPTRPPGGRYDGGPVAHQPRVAGVWAAVPGHGWVSARLPPGLHRRLTEGGHQHGPSQSPPRSRAASASSRRTVRGRADTSTGQWRARRRLAVSPAGFVVSTSPGRRAEPSTVFKTTSSLRFPDTGPNTATRLSLSPAPACASYSVHAIRQSRSVASNDSRRQHQAEPARSASAAPEATGS